MTRSNTLPGRISRATFPSTGTSSRFSRHRMRGFSPRSSRYSMAGICWSPASSPGPSHSPLAYCSSSSLLRSLGTGSVVAFVLVLAFVTSPFTHGPLVETRNDIMPLFYCSSRCDCMSTRMAAFHEGSIVCCGVGSSSLLLPPRSTHTFFAPPISVVVLLYDEYVRRGGKLSFYRPAHPMVRSRRFGRHASARICAGHSPGAFRLHDTALSYDGKLRLVSLARFGRDADIGA